MALAEVQSFGAPAYGPIGRPPAGIVFHTPENAGPALSAALQTARWQATSGNTSGGSYHGILAWDATRGAMTNPNAWVMVRSVPWDQASGGISTKRTNPPWNPDRFPWIRQLLPAAAFNDPNRWLHQISISGTAAWYTKSGYPTGLVIRLAEWVRWLENQYKYNAVLMLHRHWQTDRTDPGPLNLPDLILAEYKRLYEAPKPAPVPPKPPTPPPAPPVPDPAIRIKAKDAAMKAAITALTAGLEE